MGIKISNLNKNFWDFVALKNVNLDIKKGEARCISNIILENEANLFIKSGSLLCVIKQN